MFRLWLCLLPKSRLIVIHIYPVLQIQSPETHLQLCSRNPAVVSFSSLTSSQWITKITFNLLSPQHIPTSSISRHSLWTLQQTGWGNQLMKILPLPPLLQTQSLSCIPILQQNNSHSHPSPSDHISWESPRPSLSNHRLHTCCFISGPNSRSHSMLSDRPFLPGTREAICTSFPLL